MSTLKRQRAISGWVWVIVALLVILAFIAGLVAGVVFYHYGPAQDLAREAYYRGAYAGCLSELIGLEEMNEFLPTTTMQEKAQACNTITRMLNDRDGHQEDFDGRDTLFD